MSPIHAHRFFAVAAALCAALPLASCADDTAAPVTPPTAAPAAPEPEFTLDGMDDAMAAIEAETGTQVGIALFDGSTDTTAGSVGILPAWSTIKVPIAITAQEHCAYDEATVAALTAAAIEYSDNDAAAGLWSCIGSDQEASRLVGEEIAKGGMSVQVEPFFGTTAWPVPAQARYAHHLASVPADNLVIQEMHKIDPDQSYGLGRIADVPFKGGWSDAHDGSWHSRQLGFTTVGEKTYGIAIAARSVEGSEENCQAELSAIAAYLIGAAPENTLKEAS